MNDTDTFKATLTVDESVIGQKIRVRAASASGFVYGEAEVTINNTSAEAVINYNAFEEKIDKAYAELTQGSWDGSSYYVAGNSGDFMGQGTLGTASSSGDVLISIDIKFPQSGTGFTTIRRDGGTGIWLQSNSNVLAFQTGGNSWSKTTYTIDSDAWYHIDLMFNTTAPSLNIAKYEDGVLGAKTTITVADTSEKKIFRAETPPPFNRMTINKGTCIDNYRVVYPNPTELQISAADGKATLPAGSTLAFDVTGIRENLVLANLAATAVTWQVLDNDNLQTEDENISIKAGKLSAYGLTKPQTVKVQALLARDRSVVSNIVPIAITESTLFEVTNIGYDSEDNDRLVRVYVNKNGDYNDDAAFVVVLYDSNDKIVGSYVRNTTGKNLKLGENEVAIDYKLPTGYDTETGKAKVFVWTSLSTNADPAPESGTTNFTAAYDSGSVTLSGLPTVTGKTSIAVYAPGTTDGDLSGDMGTKIVYIAQNEGVPSNAISVPELTAGTYIIAVGATVDGEYRVYRAEFTVQ